MVSNQSQKKIPKPIGSMYGKFAYIWLIFMVNVNKYTIDGSYGKVGGKAPSPKQVVTTWVRTQLTTMIVTLSSIRGRYIWHLTPSNALFHCFLRTNAFKPVTCCIKIFQSTRGRISVELTLPKRKNMSPLNIDAWKTIISPALFWKSPPVFFSIWSRPRWWKSPNNLNVS